MEHTVLSPTTCLFTVKGLLTPAECDQQIALTEAEGYGAAPITTWMGPVMAPGVRDNSRVMIDDPERADWVWRRLHAFVPPKLDGWSAVGLNERFRFYRYEEGEQFRWHRDGSYVRSRSERSLLTVLVYLNGGFEGGMTVFGDGLAVVPEPGMALVFQHPLLHQGSAVLAGVKYVMRTDVMYAQTPPDD